jgi:hyperosmotically inducible periplasmic protein
MGAESMMTAMMTRRAIGIMSASMATLLISPAVPARAQEGAAERAGEALDNAGRNIRRGVENAVARGRTSAQEQELLARVYGRIHWDRTLIGSSMVLEVQEGGTTVLRGSVPTKVARDRAVVLARDTIGVTQVVDELVITPNVRIVPVPAPAPTPTARVTVVKPARVVPAPAATTETETTITTTVTKP